MSSLSKFFGSKKHDVTPQEATRKLREAYETLEKKQAFIETKIEGEIASARKYGMKNKRAALQALARKKRYEAQLTQLDGMLTTLETQMSTLDNATTNMHVFDAVTTAGKALKSAHKDMDVDKVHDMMDDVQEQQEISRELADAISQPIGYGIDVDEDDLLRELEELEESDLNEKLLDVESPGALPSVPAGAPLASVSKSKTKHSKEENELSELAAWLN